MQVILAAIDASQRAPKVLETAIQLAQKTGAKLHLVRAVGLPPEIPMSPFGVTPDGFLQVLVDESKRSLETTAKNVPASILGGTETRIGTPWSAICQTAKDLKADLIVVGSHGYSGVDRLLGTTAAKVVNHAECSVLVARNLEI